MDITTINTILGATLVFIGSVALYILGSIRSYMKNLDDKIEKLYTMTTEHKVKLEGHENWLKTLDDKVYKLNK